MSLKETVMRKAIGADGRLPFEEIFFDRAFDSSLTKEKAGKLFLPLEMVRWAPSAVNKQPWRALVDGDCIHFYLKRSKGFASSDVLDMQRIDLGIALCHFDLAAKELGLTPEFALSDPSIPDSDLTYIASYRVG